MKKSFLLILAGAFAVSSSLPIQATDESPLTFFGARRYAEEGSPASQAAGIYSVEAKAGAQPELKFGSGDVMANGSTAYNDKDLYVTSYLDFTSWGMGLMWWQQKISPDTWTELQIDNLDSGELGIFDIAAATCYDPTTATVYAICLGDDQAQAFDLCILDLETGKMRHLFPLEKKLASLSFNAQGEAYGIGYDGFLYSLDKSTGAVNQIGDTGYRPTVDQCSIIEYKTGDFYWSAYTDEFKGVLKVDLTTAATEVVTQFDYAFQFGGFYINQSAFEPGAPVTASNLSANFEGASLAGEVTFTMPEKAIDGSDLEGELGWEVSIEGAEPVTGTAAPGSEVKANVTAPSAGTTLIVVRCSAEGNYGIATNTSLWTGMDTPKAVTDLSLEMDGDLAQMSWTLPERGVHEGYVDHSLVRYVIIRGPEDVCVDDAFEGTAFSETVKRDGMYPLMYTVQPYIGDLKGETVLCDYVLAGNGFVPDFSIDLTDPFASLLFDFTDSNDDTATWYYDRETECIVCPWPISTDRKRDDWMISSQIYLETGKTYSFRLGVRSEGRWDFDNQVYVDQYAGELGAYIGQEQNPDAMTRCLIKPFEVVSKDWGTVESEAFSVEEDGWYYIGLHESGGIETGNIYNTYLNSFGVTTVSGIANAGAGEGFKACAVAGGIAIDNPAGTPVAVMTPDGRQAAFTSETSARLSLAAGIYIVAGQGRTYKLYVK